MKLLLTPPFSFRSVQLYVREDREHIFPPHTSSASRKVVIDRVTCIRRLLCNH